MKKILLLFFVMVFFNFAGVKANHVVCGQTIYTDTVLDSDLLGCTANGITIGANDITLDCNGHSIRGINTAPSYGIYLPGKQNVEVRNCSVSLFYRGLEVDASSNNTLTNNIANSNNYGIWLWESSNNTLTDNTASGTNNGISLSYSSSNTLTNNTANSNIYFGIRLFSSSNNTLTGNKVKLNVYNGIYLRTSSNNNILTNNEVNSNYNRGIHLSSSSNNTLTDNIANSNNAYGIFLASSSSNNVLTSNIANLNNNYGIFLNSSSNNLIYNNYFNNTNNAWDNGTNSWNITKTPGTNIIGGPFLGGNFWHDYAGQDMDGDGIGDTNIPYNASGNIVIGGDFLPLTITTDLRAAFLGGCALPPYGLIGWWPGDGNAIDIAGGNNGTLMNGAGFGLGKVKLAFNLDGINDYVFVPNSPALQNANSTVTLDAWIFTTSLSPQMIMVKRNSLYDKQWYFRLIPSGAELVLEFVIHDGAAFRTVTSSIPVPRNQWNLVAAVYNKNEQTVTFYVNGATEVKGFPYVMRSYSSNINIGAQSAYNEMYFKGLIDEVEIFDSALTASQLDAIYRAGSKGKCRPQH